MQYIGRETKYTPTSHVVDAERSEDLDGLYSRGSGRRGVQDFEGPGRYRLYIHTIHEYDEYAGIEV